MSDYNDRKMLVRTRDGRIIAGVCSGLSEYFGLDATLIRVIVAVLTVFTGGFGALAYLAAWVVIPEEVPRLTLRPADTCSSPGPLSVICERFAWMSPVGSRTKG